jgi:RimJ/RimL family protein N-acetyltransferase
VALPVPDLHDDVVALRPPNPGDVPAITAAVQDPDISRFTMVPSPYDEADAVAYVDSSQAAWRDASRVSFVIVERATGTLLGAVGVHHLDHAAGTAEVGYWVASTARRAGVATRALRLVAGWALGDLGLQRLEALVFTDNARSRRVAERAGFVNSGVAPARVEHPSGLRDAFVLVRTADGVRSVEATRSSAS